MEEEQSKFSWSSDRTTICKRNSYLYTDDHKVEALNYKKSCWVQGHPINNLHFLNLIKDFLNIYHGNIYF